MFCFLLLQLVVADARLRGSAAQEPGAMEAPPAGVSCGRQAAAAAEAEEEAEAPQDGFDELALLQRELTPSTGMHKKNTKEWLEHYNDHKSKITDEERVLHNETVEAQLSKVNSGSCVDDAMWRDADGDGCEIYLFAITSGKATREAACGGGGLMPPPATGLRGARSRIVADASAKVFCPATCGMCQPGTGSDEWIATLDRQDDGDGLQDDVTFLQVGVTAASGSIKKSVKSWEEHAYDHKSRITSDQRTLHNETVAFRLSQLQKGEGCADDPLWRDADGDGCEIYKFAIDSGKTTREVACGGGGQSPPPRGLRGSFVQVVADATAKVFCPVTCGAC